MRRREYCSVILISMSAIVAGCATTTPAPQPTEQRQPWLVDQTENDKAEVDFRQRDSWSVFVAIPSYENADYAACAEQARASILNAMKDFPWIKLSETSLFSNTDDTARVNAICHDEPALLTLAHEKGIEGLVLVLIDDVSTKSEDIKVGTGSASPGSQRSETRAQVALKLKVFDAIEMQSLLQKDFAGASRVDSLSSDSRMELLAAAVRAAVQPAQAEIASVYRPSPTVVEVRGNGKYARVNAGTNWGIREGEFLDVCAIAALKDPSGKTVSKEIRRVSSILVIYVEPDSCWCDATLSQGLVLRGHLVQERE